MTVSYLGEKVFFDEIEETKEIWIARGSHKNIYCVEISSSCLSVPVWSSAERTQLFIKNARPIGQKYEPEAVPLDHFTNTWLSDPGMGITELQINPDGMSSRVLVYTAEEFKAAQYCG